MNSPKQVDNQTSVTRSGRRDAGHPDTSRRVDAQVREQIARLLPSEPTIMAVANALGMTVRTLQRRLSAADLSYRQILDDFRRRMAEAELISNTRSVAMIARRLGYSDPSHFCRAFRRWTGYPPSHFTKFSGAQLSRLK